MENLLNELLFEMVQNITVDVEIEQDGTLVTIHELTIFFAMNVMNAKVHIVVTFVIRILQDRKSNQRTDLPD